ncbi:MAG: PDGLE domain-containing protein [Actinomycetota bacterium]
MDRRNLSLFIVGGLIVALGLAFFLSPLASGSPDGLEKVAGEHGFIDTAEDHALSDSPLADYSADGIENEAVSTGVAGIIGVVITFGVGMLLFASLRTYRSHRGQGEAPSAGSAGSAGGVIGAP